MHLEDLRSEETRNLKQEVKCLRHELQQLKAAVKKVHAAKGRYHNQQAMCDLYDLLGLINVRPENV